MGLGSFTLACLMFAVSAGGAADEWHMSQTQFKIPIKIKPDLQADIHKLRLFCSRDEGKTWNLVGTADPNQDGFLFTANGDGKYWFSVAVVNKAGVQEPTDVYTAPVGQKIIVDTVKPDVHVIADRQGDQVTVAWEINELYPKPESLKVEYRAAEAVDGPWNPVPVASGANRASFKPDCGGNVAVRVQMEDQAGNLGSAQATVVAANTLSSQVVQAGSPPPPAAPPSTALPPPAGPPAPLPVNTAPSPNFSPATPNLPPARPSDIAPASIQQSYPTQSPGALAGSTPASGLPLSIRGRLPDLQLVNKDQVRLDYEVARLGPSGVGSVEVYVTTDEGQTWEAIRAEAAHEPPVTDPQTGNVRSGVLVPLAKDEVVYGFCMIVKSGAGLGKAPPKSGDQPQIRIERDTVPPVAILRQPIADPTHRDTVILGWDASDKNLAVNPITLEWSATSNKDAQWQIIAEKQPNSGHYAWSVPPKMPPAVFLRITARDLAGNTTVWTTDRAETIDLNIPEVTKIGLSGVR
jgi:hypothetical protein